MTHSLNAKPTRRNGSGTWMQNHLLKEVHLKRFSKSLGLAGLLVFGFIPNSQAVITEVYRQTGSGSIIDQAFENWEYDDGVNPTAPGWLRTNYSLPRIRTSATNPAVYNSTVLPQVERAVAQIALNNANGLHVPSSGSGIPGVANSGLQSPGVLQALTNYAITTTPSGPALPNFTTGTNVNLTFEFKLLNDIVSYSVTHSGGTRTWTTPSTQAYYDEINAIEIRVSNGTNNTLGVSNLVLTDTNGTVNLSTVAPPIAERSVVVWTGITGDFTLTGNYTYVAGTGGWNHQIKGLSLIPEPTTVGLLGLTLAGLLFRRTRTHRG